MTYSYNETLQQWEWMNYNFTQCTWMIQTYCWAKEAKHRVYAISFYS